MNPEVLITVLQVVGSVLGPILLLLVRRKLEAEKEPHASSGATQAPKIATEWLSRGRDRALLAERQLVLSASLIATAICCTVALGVIRTNSTIDAQLAFVIGLLVCVAMPSLSIWAWRLDALPLVLGYWCLLSATLQVALGLTAPSGEYTLPSFSIATILLISIAAVAYFVGSPGRRGESLDKLSPPLRRVVRLISWPLVVLLCSVLVLLEGRSIIAWVTEAPYVTRPQLEEARATADHLLALEDEDLHTFYRMASELALLPVYREAFENGGFDGSAFEDGSFLVLENVAVPENREEYSGVPPFDVDFVKTLNRNHFDRYLPFESTDFEGEEAFEQYRQEERDWRRRLAREQDFYGPWNWFSGEEFTRQDRHRQRRLLQLRAEIVHPLSPVDSRHRTVVNTFTAAERLVEFSRVRKGWAAGFEPGYEPELQGTGLSRSISRGVAQLFEGQDPLERYWVFPKPGPDIASEERARQVIATYPRLSDPVLEEVLKAQLLNTLASDDALTYWEYLHLALSADDDQRLQVGRGFLDLAPEDKDLVRQLLIRPGPAGASEADGIFDSMVWYLGGIRGDENAASAIDQIRSNLPPESFKLSLLGRKSELLDNPVLGQIKQAAQDEDRRPFVERLPGDVLIGLLSDEVMDFCRAVSRVSWQDARDYRTFLSAVDDPVQAGWLRILTAEDPDSPMLHNLELFAGLTQAQKEAVLTELALDKLYSAPSAAARIPFHFGRAYNDSPILGWTVVVGLGFLVVLGFLWLGLRLSRIFSFRERILDLAQLAIRDSDESTAWGGSAPTTPVNLTGRDESLRWLNLITRRGFGTVGIVGRRGVGKTRILRGLLESTWPDAGDEPEGNGARRWSLDSIGVWLSVPSGFSEREFIQDLHFSLARSVEERLAWKLRVLPYQARKLLNGLRNLEMAVWLILGVLFTLVWVEIGLAATTGAAAAFWWAWFVIAVAALLAVVSLSSLPPVNLYSWLVRGHSNSRAGVIAASLYQLALGFIQDSRSRPRSFRWASGLWRAVLSIIGGWLVFMGFVLAILSEGEFSELLIASLLFGGAILLFALARNKHESSAGHPDGAGGQAPLAAVIRSYRDFAQEVVSALGHLGGDRPGRIIICLDELDKIISPEEIREFLRRMKVLFEIRGVFYFISLAEDARQKLVLGTTYGKDEVDSSFDHIRRLKPLDSAQTTALLAAYWRQVEEDEEAMLPERIEVYCLAFSGGVARDVFRALDAWATEIDLGGESSAAEREQSFLFARVDDEWQALQELVSEFADHDDLLREIASLGGDPGDSWQAEEVFRSIGELLRRSRGAWAEDIEDLAKRELGLRGLLRIFLLLFVLVDWDDAENGFRVLGSDAWRDELCALSYLVPVGRISRLIDRATELTSSQPAGELAGAPT